MQVWTGLVMHKHVMVVLRVRMFRRHQVHPQPVAVVEQRVIMEYRVRMSHRKDKGLMIKDKV